MKRVTLLVLVAAVAALVFGCGVASARSPGENVGVFMTRILREEIKGQWARQWDELHPGHQRLITRLQYVACARALQTDIATGAEVFNVLDVRDEAINVPSVPQRTSKLVTLSFHARGSAKALTYRLHAVATRGRWAWILGPRFLSAIAHGRCLDGSPLPSAK
jgi:hypothetical protein